MASDGALPALAPRDANDDSDWAIEYATYLHAHASDLLPATLTRGLLVKVLLELDNEHAARAEAQPWAEFIAQALVERFVPAPDERLQLFIGSGCGFCTRVLRVIDELHIEIEVRDVYRDPTARKELIAARGRATVPVLRCTTGDVDRYMPESADIIRYLRGRFGAGAHAG